MFNTSVRPVRDLHNNYAEIESLLAQGDQVIITKNGRGAAVLIPFEVYAGFEEYLHHKYIAEKLKESEAEAQKSDTQWLSGPAVIAQLREKYRDL